MPTTAELIRKERETAGVTGAELARRLGCTSQYVSALQRNRRGSVLGNRTLEKIAAALQIAPEQLRGDDASKRKARILRRFESVSEFDEFKQTIKNAIESGDWTPESLAEKAVITPSTLYSLLYSPMVPHYITIRKISNALGLTHGDGSR